jgi:uncharacterized protein YhaN
MRLLRLDLKAFGPFTGRSLVFASEAPGLHIIHGPNEAGKSSSLRALKALLYGFPERTTDNFIHPNSQLLVGGIIRGTDGRELSLLRRKKRKADLLDADGNPLDPDVLSAFLQGIEPALFESLYGIDHQTLVAGGEDILAQKGEVGQALFAAGAGISSLKRILDSLDAEADALFKARGTRQEINRSIREYKDLKKAVREASLPTGRWKEHEKRLHDAEAELSRLEEESRKKSAEVQRLVRLNRALPELAELDSLQHRLRAMGDVPVLPPEFQKEFREVEQNIRETGLRVDKDRVRLEKIRARQSELTCDRKILDHAETVEDLYQRLGAFRDGQRDRGRLDGMRITQRRDAGRLIEEIRPDLKLRDADLLRPFLARKRTIQDLCSRFEVLEQMAAETARQKDEAESELEEINSALSGLPQVGETGDLEKAVRLASRAGGIDEHIREMSRETEIGKDDCRTGLQRLGLWSGGPEELLRLSLPLQETVRTFEAKYIELDRERQELRRDRQKAAGELRETGQESRETAAGGPLPTELDLQQSRDSREKGWRLLRRRWLEGEDIAAAAREYAREIPLHAAYEQHVARADQMADRLRREAGRVAKAAALQARKETLEETIREIERQEKELQVREQKLDRAWEEEWRPLRMTPLTPREMLAWLNQIETMRIKASDMRNRENELAVRKAARHTYRDTLIRELELSGEQHEFPGEELAPVLVAAESALEQLVRRKAERESLREKRDQVERAILKIRKKEADIRAEKAGWEKKWNRSLSGLGLKEEILPGEALDLLEIAGDCLGRIEKADELQSRISGIDRDTAAFAEDVGIMLEKTGIEAQDLPPEQAVLHAYTRLDTTRQNSRLLKKNNEEIETLAIDIAGGEKTLASLDRRMQELLATAGCRQVEDLPPAIRKSEEYLELQERVGAARTSLAKMSDGLPMEEIRRQAESLNVDELPGRIAALRRAIEEELAPRISDVLKMIGEERGELKHMDGSARAAEAAENMEQVAARIRRHVEHYTRIRLAAMVLKNEIDRYREEHQDPVLRLASGYFHGLTLGSFAGLRTDIDDNGNPVLTGIRPDDSRLTVEAMSDGTRDQLYLALRLATLEWRLEANEPLPFIVDDILVNFDDDRSRATLSALAGLGEKNQVILFTHHRQIVQEAEKLRKTKPVYIHSL